MRIIGIDPGKSGGFALLDVDLEAGLRVTRSQAAKVPETERDVQDFLARACELAGGPAHCTAVIEKVHAMPKQGVTSMFTFGQSYGFLRGCVIGLRIALITLSPAAWQKAVGVNQKFASPKDRKNAHKARAQELFPLVNGSITHATADALLIAEAHRRTALPNGKDGSEGRHGKEELF